MVHPLIAQEHLQLPPLPVGFVSRRAIVGPGGADSRVLVVQGPAGFGKSTLAREVVDGSAPVAWLTLEAADQDPAVFLLHLSQALQMAVGEMESLTPHHLAMAEVRAREAFLGRLVEALAAATFRVSLVLDDIHHVLPNEECLRILDTLVRVRLPFRQVILTTRYQPPDGWSRMQLSGVVRVVGVEDLTFGPEETRALFANFGQSIDSAEAQRLTQIADGWVASLSLWAQSGRATSVPADLEGSAALFEFLADQVLGKEAPDVQRFLLETSVLRRLSPALCDRLTGDEAREHLRVATSRNLFLVPLDAARLWWRYHNLFRGFLEQRLRAELGSPHWRAVHLRAARAWQEEGDTTEVLEHLLAAGDWDATVKAMQAAAPEYLEAGATLTVARWLERLPRAFRLDPGVAHIEGIVLMHRGQLTDAGTRFAHAHRAYRGGGHVGDASRSAFWLASTLVARGEHLRVLDLPLAEGVDTDDPWQPFLETCVADCLMMANRKAEARALWDRAAAHPQTATSISFRGYHGAMRAVYDLHHRGEIEAARDACVEAISLLEASDPLNRLPHVIGFLLLILWDLGDPDPIAYWCSKARSASQERGTLEFTEPWIELLEARLDVRNGHLDQARRRLGALDSSLRRGGYLWRPHHLDLAHAELAAAGRDPTEFSQRAAVAAQKARDFGYQYEVAWILCALADAALLVDDFEFADRCAAEALGVAEGAEAMLLVSRAASIQAVLAAASEAADRSAATAADGAGRGATAHSEGPAGASAAVRGRQPLAIHTLGGFRVQVGGRALSDSSWGRRRARQLFKLLLCARNGPLHRGEIIDALWPDADEDTGQHGLNTASYWLRRAFQPGMGRRQESHYLVVSGETYCLPLSPDDSWDLQRVAEVAGSDTAGLDEYAKALALVRRGFLPDERYESWTEPIRRFVGRIEDDLIQRVLRARGEGASEQIRPLLESITESEPWREDVVTRLVEIYGEAGDSSRAVKAFHRCRDALHDELGTRPGPELESVVLRYAPGAV